MKRTYNTPSVKLLLFNRQDIITTSGLFDSIIGGGDSGNSGTNGNKTPGNDFINVGGDLVDSTD